MADEWDRLKQLFTKALELGPEERVAFLANACAGQDALRKEVESLLAHHDVGGFIDPDGPDGSLAATVARPSEFDLRRTRLGHYELIKEIGRGGMGLVYLAIRADDTFQKRVAIKLVKRGMDTEAILRRFRRERQILATLEHPMSPGFWMVTRQTMGFRIS
jgi:serine/threonine protein kinase